jgi:hypothetical protein
MATVIFTGAQGRMTVRGSCLASDLDHLVGALEAFGRTSPNLILDVSRVSVMSWSVAEALLRACRSLEVDGARVSWRTRAGSAAERMIFAVRDEPRQQLLVTLSGRRI